MLKYILFYKIILLFSLHLFCASIIHSQVNIHSAGADFGIIDNVEANSKFFSDTPIFYPEVFISGEIAESYLNWKINLGYWDDMRSDPEFADAPNFSFSVLVINAEIIYLTPSSNPNYSSPFRFLAGLSYHHISAKDIELYESNSFPRKDYSDNLFYFNAGLELHLFLSRILSLFTKGIIYLQLNNSQDNYYKSPRYQLSLGVNYNFGNG